jgi:hypothetical protein
MKRYRITTYNDNPRKFIYHWKKEIPESIWIISGEYYDIADDVAHKLKVASFFDYKKQQKIKLFHLKELIEE